ncbi:MAG: glycosyltransferase [Candidatus Limnocylindria bacterium]
MVRPQNYFAPAPWHARWDMARTLLNRISGGDWPGTLGVRRSVLLATGGYDGDVLFENLELVRTVRAAGGRELIASDLYVRRLPSTVARFWSQRVRQAYDELARPARLALSLLILPVATLIAAADAGGVLVLVAAAAIALAETGRRREGGAAVFPATTALFAPLWLAERAICAWLAVGARLTLGGIPYRGRVLRRAASSERELRERLMQRPRSRRAA